MTGSDTERWYWLEGQKDHSVTGIMAQTGGPRWKLHGQIQSCQNTPVRPDNRSRGNTACEEPTGRSWQMPSITDGCKAQADEVLCGRKTLIHTYKACRTPKGLAMKNAGNRGLSWRGRPAWEPTLESSQVIAEHAFPGGSKIIQGIYKITPKWKPYHDALTRSCIFHILTLTSGPNWAWRDCPSQG